MRSLAISAFILLGAAGTASAQALAGGPQMLDCRPIATEQTENGVSVTRGFRTPDRAPVATMDGYRCYGVGQPAPAPQNERRGQSQTIIILNGGDGPFGLFQGTSPNVLGAPQPRRF